MPGASALDIRFSSSQGSKGRVPKLRQFARVVVKNQTSAGLLLFRGEADTLEVFLAHPGGPYFRRKDEGAWSIPKGLVEPGEDPRAAAIREFTEETGLPVEEPLIPLGSIVQRGGKTVVAWAFRGTAPADFVPTSNTFELEWPPRSGRHQAFPEIDRAEFFVVPEALRKLNAAQAPFVERLQKALTQ